MMLIKAVSARWSLGGGILRRTYFRWSLEEICCEIWYFSAWNLLFLIALDGNWRVSCFKCQVRIKLWLCKQTLKLKLNLIKQVSTKLKRLVTFGRCYIFDQCSCFLNTWGMKFQEDWKLFPRIFKKSWKSRKPSKKSKKLNNARSQFPPTVVNICLNRIDFSLLKHSRISKSLCVFQSLLKSSDLVNKKSCSKRDASVQSESMILEIFLHFCAV
jgi:hypothetical protein